MIDASVLEF